MKKIAFSFLFAFAVTHTVQAKVQINCDLKLLDGNGQLDATIDPPEVKNFVIIEEKSEAELEDGTVFTTFTEKSSGCFVHGRIGWQKAYDKKGKVELTIVNPKIYEGLCFADNRESLIAGRIPYKVSTHIEFGNPPERFLLNLPSPSGINVRSVNNTQEGINVREIHLECRRVK